MAFFDNKKFLISHIRHSFISCDDTGMCEAVMAGEHLGSSGSNENHEYDSDLSHSYDIVSDMDIGAHRRRSNTAVRLERLKKEKKNQIKTKNIQWSNCSQNLSAEDANEMFKKKEVKPRKEQRRSLLAEQLATSACQPNNPFNEYAKYDGKAHSGLPTKKIQIFLTMLDPDERKYPMDVVTLTTAKVQDLIGLICWQYVNQNKKPELKSTIECYSLHIAEDDGEVDLDFPNLDAKDNISKFGFSVLALVERSVTSAKDTSVIVTIHSVNDGIKKLKLENDKINIHSIIEKFLKSLSNSLKLKAHDFNLEKLSDSGISLESNSLLCDLNCDEFMLVGSSNPQALQETEEWTLNNMTAMGAPLYESYTVYLFQKLKLKSEIHLGISGEKIELDPVKHNSNKFWNRSQKQKPESHDIDTVAACDLVEIKYPDKAVFKLTLQTMDHEFKHYEFEADKNVVVNIVNKMAHILEMRSSTAHREYMTLKEKKAIRRPFSGISR